MAETGTSPMRRVVRLATLLVAAVGTAAPAECRAGVPSPIATSVVLGQFPPMPQRADRDSGPQPDVFPRPDRALLRQLSNAKDLAAQQRWAEAVRCLDVVLQSPEDYLYQPDEKEPLHRSLRSEANHLLGQMPAAGREVYELQYGARARRLLEEAVAARNRDLLDDVSRRFFHTAAGYEATFLLGLYDLDHGEALAAAMTLQELREERTSAARFEPALSLTLATCWHRAGLADKAEAVLRELRDRRGATQIAVAGREEPLSAVGPVRLAAIAGPPEASPAERRPAAAEWTQPRGNAARTASVEASLPLLDPVWRVPTTDHPVAESLLAAEAQCRVERAAPMVPALQPLALDGVVLMRSLQTLIAIDCRTGKRLWEAPAEDLLAGSPDAYRAVFSQPTQLAGVQCQRVWQDAVYGALASDGRRVMAIEDLGIGPTGYGLRRVIQGGRRVAESLWPSSTNRLAAYDIRTGKLVWHLGGAAERFGLDLAGAFFLGAPLPMSDRLYQLAETSGEIRLVALESASGRVLWSQRIAMVDQGILDSPLRRLSAVSPSHRDGIVVCPTAAGAIVGVKLARRSLLWGYGYPRSPAAVSVQTPFPTVTLGAGNSSRWTDASIVIAEDRVLATPPDSDEIHCLSLLDGKLLWKKPREDGLFLATVRGKTAVLVGTSHVRALSLEDGRPAWDGRAVELPEGSVASGQGFRTGSLYYLPTSAAEILVVDLDAGKIAATIRSPEGAVPGNLICYGDKIISQGIDGVAAFDQIEPLRERIARRLAENPNDADALRRKGQVLLAAGQRAEAVECLRRSYALDPGQKCRQQLREALLDGLRVAFPQYQSAAAEVEKLIDAPADRVKFLCLVAAGLQSQSAWKPALEHYQRLADHCGKSEELIEVDRGHLVRPDRWIAAQLSAFRDAAPADVVEELDRWLRQRLDAALGEASADALARLVACFRGQPAAAEAERELVRRYLASGELLKAELLLSRRLGDAEPAEAAAVALQLAAAFQKAGRIKDAAAWYRELEERWPEVVCHEGKTGRQIVSSFAPSTPLAAAIHPERVWPVGAVRATTQATARQTQLMRATIPLAFQGSAGPFFRHRSCVIDQTERHLVLLDGFGREEWRTRVPGLDRYSYFPRPYTPRLAARGHLLFVLLGSRVVAVDALGRPGARVLWDKTVTGAGEGVADDSGLGVGGLGGQFGPRIIVRGLPDQEYAPEGQPLGAVTEDYACSHRFRRCVAWDPLSGKTLWSRSDLPARCAVFGDSQRVFLVPGNQNEAIVLRAGDGERLSGTRTVPPRRERLATLDGKILRWRLDVGKFELDLFDPWAQKSIWGPHCFSADAKYCLLGHEAIGIMQRDGRFSLFAMSDGRKRIDARLAPEPTLESIMLFDSGTAYVLVTSAVPTPAAPGALRWRSYYGVASKAIQAGRVYALGRSGEQLWADYPQGVAVSNQQLLLNQPAWLPVLAFAAQTYRPTDKGIRWLTSVLMLDKRTGREALKEGYEDQMTYASFTGDPAAKTVVLAMRQRLITLSFTDASSTPDAKTGPAGGAKDARGVKTLDGILKVLKKVSGG